ncbi:hypothetical protein ROHU_021042 [Labeo rohita]|uniref:Uncharacterized protein n=1 Tax=Labeo rohita TaxID=84645 RepID=A0A498MW58_LABRO|nr:hypothetical protein ROHU_021042 [Labeo rohita]
MEAEQNERQVSICPSQALKAGGQAARLSRSDLVYWPRGPRATPLPLAESTERRKEIKITGNLAEIEKIPWIL